MKNKFLLLFFIVSMQTTFANNLVISNVTKISDSQLTFDISWDNYWNYIGTASDGVWVFVKYKDNSGQWKHLDGSNNINITTSSTLNFSSTYYGGLGRMIFGQAGASGTASGTVTVSFDASTVGIFPDFRVFGIEMVQVNQGAFYLGDGLSNNRFYQGNDSSKPYYVQNSNTLTYGNTASDINGGTITQDVPATFPNGFDAFYMMKYEITQEQYVEFLNTLTFIQQQNRTQSDLNNIANTNHYVMSATGTPSYRNGIRTNPSNYANEIHTFYCDLNNNGTPNEANDGQNVPCTQLSVNDMLAFLEWAGLRPITTLEFEKACRGTAYPVPGETAMGTSVTPTSVTSILNAGANNEVANDLPTSGGIVNYNYSYPIRVGCFAKATTSNRIETGASYYGAMNMQGNLLEWCVPAGEITYTNIMGTGILDVYGLNTTWSGLSFLQIKTNQYLDNNIDPVSKINASTVNFNLRYNANIRGVVNF